MKLKLITIFCLIIGQLASGPVALATENNLADSVNQIDCKLLLSPKLSADIAQILAARDFSGKEKHQANEEYSAPRRKTAFDKSFVIADWAMASVAAVSLFLGFQMDPSEIVPAALLVVPTLFTADFISQMFHKWLDSYASERSLIWGTPAREFRKHHEFPGNLNNTDYLSHVSAFGKVMAPAFLTSTLLITSGHLDPAEGSAVWLLLVSLLNTTEFHKQAHKQDRNLFWRSMQKLKLALNRQTHIQHHSAPFDTHYAVFNGWSHSMTEGISLWNRLDRIWWKTFKKLPNNWIQDPRSLPTEVLRELEADLSKIPADLWVYAEAYPNRISPELKFLLEQAKQKIIQE